MILLWFYFSGLIKRVIHVEKIYLVTGDWNQSTTAAAISVVFTTARSKAVVHITKTCLYNFDPLKPHFYKVQPGLTWVYIIFLISAQKHRLWVLVRTASPRRFERVPTIYVFNRNVKNIKIFYLEIFIFWW